MSKIEITKKFNKKNGTKGVFENTGIMFDRNIKTIKTEPDYEGKTQTLSDILISHNEVSEDFYLGEDLEKWKYLKGSKNEKRKKSNGEVFYYKEGPLSFPDSLDKPARTIITSEGGITPSRFKHVVEQQGRLRRLTPVELERTNMFPDNFTEEANDTKRSFFMGNALVVGIVERLGKELFRLHNIWVIPLDVCKELRISSEEKSLNKIALPIIEDTIKEAISFKKGPTVIAAKKP